MNAIVRKLAWQFWNDPTQYMPVMKEIPGVSTVPVVFSQAERVGDFYDFMFKVMPYSTQRQSPEMMYQKMITFLTQWLLPTLPAAQLQGSTVDFDSVSKTLANYLGLESFSNFYIPSIPQQAGNVPYRMSKDQKNPGQGNDSIGATGPSKMANLSQQQARSGGQSSKPNNNMGM